MAASDENAKMAEMAQTIISDAPERLRLTNKEWDEVFELVKEGVRQGREMD